MKKVRPRRGTKRRRKAHRAIRGEHRPQILEALWAIQDSLGDLGTIERRLAALHAQTGVLGELQDLEALLGRVNTLSIEARQWFFARLRRFWPAYWEQARATRPPGGEWAGRRF